MVERGEPGPAPLRALRRVERGVRALLLAIAGEGERPLQDGDTVGAIPDHLARRGALAVADQVPAPELHRVESQRPGDHVHVPLASEERLRGAEPAERAERHRVREHGAPPDPHVLARIRSGGMDEPARQHHGRERPVRAAVEQHLDILGEETPVRGEPSSVADLGRMAFRGRGHVLRAVVDQLHRAAGLECEQRRMERDGRRVFLFAPEPAARRGLNHANARLVTPQRVLQRGEHVVRALHRTLHHEHVVLEPGDHPLGFQVDVLLGARFIDALDHHGSLAQRALHVALLDLQPLEHVVRPILDLVGPRRHTEVEHGRLGLDHHGDRPGGPACLVPRRVGDEQDGLVHVPDVPARQDGLVLLDQGDHVRPRDVAVVDHHELGPVHLLGEADGGDPAPGRGAPHRHAPQEVLERQVIDVALAPRELGQAFATLHQDSWEGVEPTANSGRGVTKGQ